jgi:hypothetical protein
MISSMVNAFFAAGAGVGSPGFGLGVLAGGFTGGVPVAGVRGGVPVAGVGAGAEGPAGPVGPAVGAGVAGDGFTVPGNEVCVISDLTELNCSLSPSKIASSVELSFSPEATLLIYGLIRSLM